MRPPHRLSVEALEDRAVPAVTAPAPVGGVLTISFGSANDSAQVGSAAGAMVRVSGNGLNAVFYPAASVNSIVVQDTGGAGGQTLQVADDAGAPQLVLSGPMTVTGIEGVNFGNPTNPTAVNGGLTITGAQTVTQTNALAQLSTNVGTINITAAGTGDAIGTAANPIRITGPGGSLAANTFAGAGNQYYDLGGGLLNVNGGAAGSVRAGAGTITLTNGQFFGQGADDFGNNSTFNVSTGGIISVFNSEVIGGLTGTGRVRASGAGSSTVVVGNNNTSSTFAGVIANGPGTLGFQKTGTGTVALGGTNTYTGPTTATAGTLLVNGSLAAGSTVTVSGTDPNASTFLGGSGVINGPVQVQAGAVIGPGDPNNTATLGTGNLSFQTGGAFGVKIAGAAQFDALNVTGSVNLTNGGLFSIPTGPTPAVGSVLTVIANDGADAVVGTFVGLPEGAIFRDVAGNPYRISYVGGSGNDVTLTAMSPGAPLLGPLLVAGAGSGNGSLFTPTNGQYGAGATVPLIPGFAGEVHVALGDIDHDGTPDFVAATGAGASRVRVLSGANGAVLADFTAFPGYAGGVFVAAGDLNGDGFADIAVTPDAADAFSGPIDRQLPVRVFSGASMTNGTGAPSLLAAFNGLAALSGANGESAGTKLGGRPAIADVNGDGLPDLLIAAGSGGGPRITIWNGTGFAGANGGQPTTNPLANLFVFESTQRGGAFVASGDINGDGAAEIVVGGGPGGGPRVRVVNSAILLGLPNLEGVNLDDPVNLANGLVLNNFFAGASTLRGGVRVAVRDVDGDRLADVVVGSGSGEQSGVRVYRSPSLAGVAGTSNEPGGAQTFDPFGGVIPTGVWVG